VRRIATALAGLACCTGGGITDKPVVIEAGNNIQLTVSEANTNAGFTLEEDTGPRLPTIISIDAASGLGTGAFQTCGSLESAIRRIGGAGVDENGDFSLEGEACTWVESRLEPGAPGAPTHPNTDYLIDALDNLLQLHANCTACCKCSDYGSVYEELAATWARARTVATTLEALRIRYNQMVEEWLSVRAAKHDGLHVSLRASANPDYNLGLIWMVWNNTGADMTDAIQVVTDMQIAGSSYVERTGHLDMEGYRFAQTDPLVSGNTYRITIPGLRTAQYATYTFSVRFGDSVSNRSGKVVRPRVTATAGALSVSDEKSEALVGPLRKA
jgi:hypothetical protein